MIEVSKVLISPILSEKASDMKEKHKYFFKIAIDANKIEVKQAIESIYKVEVDKVNILIAKPKKKRIRSRNFGYTKSWKKAIVTLKKGEIDFYK